MRISTQRGDPGFREDALWLDIRIEFNGVVIRNAVMADSDKGEMKTRGYPVSGMPGVYMQEDGDASYVYKGKVEIIENGTERRL